MAQAVAEEYKSSLLDLNCNSKPLISMLTMLAEENVKHAPVIVQTIVDHVIKVSPEYKLPGLYLIDSIMKNIGERYLALFSHHMISLFTSVFEKVDESTRSLLFKLRQTWSEILPNKILYGLDLKVKELDPAWPITAQQPSKGIHVNPKFVGSVSSKKEPSPDSNKVTKRQDEEKPKTPKQAVLTQLVEFQKQLQLGKKNLEMTIKKKQNIQASVNMPATSTFKKIP